MNLIENNKNELKDNLLTDELNTDLFNSIIKDYLEYNDFVKLSSVSKILNKKCIDLWNHMKSNKYKEKLTKNKYTLKKMYIYWENKYDGRHAEYCILGNSLKYYHYFVMEYFSHAWLNKVIILKENSLPKQAYFDSDSGGKILADVCNFVKIYDGELFVKVSWNKYENDYVILYKYVRLKALNCKLKELKLHCLYKNYKSSHYKNQIIVSDLKKIIKQKS
jgi:hypothetical protein